MSEDENKKIQRIKELESINLATEDIRDLVVQTKKEVEKDNELLAVFQTFYSVFCCFTDNGYLM